MSLCSRRFLLFSVPSETTEWREQIIFKVEIFPRENCPFNFKFEFFDHNWRGLLVVHHGDVAWYCLCRVVCDNVSDSHLKMK